MGHRRKAERGKRLNRNDRISIGDQTVLPWTKALHAAGRDAIHLKQASVGNPARPLLARVLDRIGLGDTLEVVRIDRLGSESHVPAVLEATPGLAALGPVYPAGVLIALPDVPAPVTAGQIRLWGRT